MENIPEFDYLVAKEYATTPSSGISSLVIVFLKSYFCLSDNLAYVVLIFNKIMKSVNML